MSEWLVIAVFFGACWLLNRWATQRDVDRLTAELLERGSR
jgi:hypothetical protein